MSQTENVLVVDMTTLRFRRDTATGATRVTTRSGAVLSAVHPRRHEKRSDLAFRAMDRALHSGAVLEPDLAHPGQSRRLRVALYNPFSGDIALGATPDTVTFTAAGAVALDPDGTPATVITDEDQRTLHLGDLALPAVERDTDATMQVVLAQG